MNNLVNDITNFIFIENKPQKADIILIPGGSRSQLIEKACELYFSNYSSLLLPSGGFNNKINNYESEWEFFKQIALAKGIKEKDILQEDKAKNTFENAKFSRKIIDNNNIQLKRALFVCKAHHSRRALMSYLTEFSSDIDFFVIPVIYERNITKENWFLDQNKINIVMKELEKIGNYFPGYIKNYAEIQESAAQD